MGISFLDNNLARYVKSLSLNNSLENYPNTIVLAKEGKYLCSRIAKKVVNNKKLFK